MRLDALEEIASTPVPATDILPFILPCTVDKNRFVRRTAIRLLTAFQEQAADVIPSLVFALRDADANVAGEAASTIGRLGVCNDDALDVLKDMLCDQGSAIRPQAANALSHLGRPGAKVLIEAITSGVYEATGPLIEMGDSIVPLIRQTFDQTNRKHPWLVQVLGRQRELSASELARLLNDDDFDVIHEAICAIKSIGLCDCLVRPLADLLDSPPNWGYLRREVLDVLMTAGESGLPAVGALLRYLKSDERDYRAVDVLAAIGPAVVPFLVAALEEADVPHPTGTWHMDVLRALKKLGPAATDALPVVEKFLCAQERFVRFDAALTFINIAKSFDVAIPILLEILQFRETHYRRDLIEVMPSFGFPRSRQKLVTALKRMSDEGRGEGHR